MRLFVALVPPQHALDELEVAMAPWRAANPSWGWTRMPQWHLTLAFLGEVDDPTDLTRRLGQVATRYPPPALSLAGAGRFGDRALWAGVQGDREPLHRLAAGVRAASRRAGVALDDGHYRPHLTLARIRSRGACGDVDPRPSTALRTAVAALDGFTGSRWTADTLHLVHSRLGTGPAGTTSYATLAWWTLTGPLTVRR